MVELSGIADLEEAKATVGKTIQLEFKEENTDPLTSEGLAEIEDMAHSASDRIKNGETFANVAAEEELANPGKAVYFQNDLHEEEKNYEFENVINEDFLSFVQNANKGDTSEVIETTDGYTFDTDGNLQPLGGFFILNFVDKKMGEKDISTPKEVDASHVLIAYTGAERAEETVTRTKEEAKQRAEEVRQKALNGESITDLAALYSDEPGAENTQGDLGAINAESNFVKPFKDAALALSENDISEVVETQFGFHVIQVNNVTETL